MFNRRAFVRTLGSSAVLPLLSRVSGLSATATRSRLDLNGQWQRRIDGELYDIVQVPSLLRPSGFYQLSREFLLPEPSPHRRSILHFDAITYFGRVSVTATYLARMRP